MSKVFDITLTLKENITVYPGDPSFSIDYIASADKAGYSLSKISMCSHTGTHIDAPAHFVQNGVLVDRLSLDVLIGKVLVSDFTNVDFIDLKSLKSIDLDKYERILFKTSNSKILEKDIFSKNYTYITPEAAQYLVEKEIRLIGFDYYTIDKYNSGNPSHKILLGNNVAVIEEVNLSGVDAGEYEIIALPLKIEAEGAPARVILKQI
jgi:arylformamidase